MNRPTEKYEFVCKICRERFVYDRVVKSRPREYCFSCFMATHPTYSRTAVIRNHSGEICVSLPPPKLTQYALDLLDRIAARKQEEARRERDLLAIAEAESNVAEVRSSTSKMDVVTRGRCCGGYVPERNKNKEY